jgi:ribosomal protein S18 acetylase RimI-like enzyme
VPVRPAEERDLPFIAALHKSQFSRYFLGQYSHRAIGEYYRSFLGKSIFLVHETTSKQDGFLLGGYRNDLLNCMTAFLRRNWLLCLWDTLLRPPLWLDAPKRALNSIVSHYFHRNCHVESETPVLRMISYAVIEEVKGKGVAVALLNAFEQEIQDYAWHYGLTVEKDNSRAIRFYQKVGFEIQQDNGDTFLLRKKLH